MDRCLRIPEVLLEVFGHLEGEKGGRNTVATLARTSTVFHHHAVGVLWKDLPGLWPVCRLFAPGTFEYDEEAYADDQQSLARDKISQLEEGILRVKKYARYVKSFHYDSPTNEQYVERLEWHCLLAFLMHPKFPKPIFPNLITVSLPCFESRPTLLFASLTLSPSVKSVTILTNFREPLAEEELTWKGLIEQLDPMGKDLDRFNIMITYTRNATAPPTVVGIIDEFCKKLKAVTELSIPEGYLPRAPLELPASLQRLRLSIRSSGSAREAMPFPTLANLELSEASEESCNMFLRALQAPKLEQLTIRYSKSIRDEEINLQEAFLVLVTSASSSRLSSIKVFKDDMVFDSPILHRLIYTKSTFPITYNTLEPLMACKSLTSVDISNCVPTKISNSDFLRILSSWPELTSLRLASAFEVDKIPELTLAGLHAALLRCPSLTYLDLPCDARTLPPTNATPHRSLAYWNVRGSPLGSSKEAAKSLSTCFPKLKALHFFEDLYGELTEFHFDTSTIDPVQVASIVRWRDVEKVVSGTTA
ncbi:hypothetical protein BKA70DRAFT_1193372 [Coprinopsis sp. MPI-PUGE-AT-0042]|nr:hypothetical protein BKA70DRAFT_1193372 [Coprinopsis sp. MPI-PUGE-AT-0042]